jgi:putative methyltransferase (TIGR04325 family)
MSVAAKKTKTLLRELVPPLAARAFRAFVPPPLPPFSSEVVGDYATWEAAATECGSGYQADEPIRREARITRAIEGSSAPLNGKEIRALAGILSCGTSRSVLDFGGGLGQHFLRLAPHLRMTNWVVCETKAMADQGRASFSRTGLEFISSLDEVATRRFDVAFTAGAIQAVPDPIAVLEGLCGLTAHIVINRLPLVPFPRNRLMVIRVRETGRPRWACPLWFFSEAWWLGHLERLGLEVTLRWMAPEDTVAIDGEPHEFQGMVLRKRAR